MSTPNALIAGAVNDEGRTRQIVKGRDGESEARILLVEEDDRIAEPLGWALASAKMEVVFANTGVQGIRAAEHASFDLCVIDHRLPDMCGVQAMRRLRDVGILVPFILMMTRATVEAVVRAMQLGAANVLEKRRWCMARELGSQFAPPRASPTDRRRLRPAKRGHP